MSAQITPEALQDIVTHAYRLCGYDVIRFGDGVVGIGGASSRQLAVTGEIQRLLLEQAGAIPRDDSPVHLVRRRGRASLCGITNDPSKEGDGWPPEFRAALTSPNWRMASATRPVCLRAYRKEKSR